MITINSLSEKNKGNYMIKSFGTFTPENLNSNIRIPFQFLSTSKSNDEQIITCQNKTLCAQYSELLNNHHSLTLSKSEIFSQYCKHQPTNLLDIATNVLNIGEVTTTQVSEKILHGITNHDNTKTTLDIKKELDNLL